MLKARQMDDPESNDHEAPSTIPSPRVLALREPSANECAVIAFFGPFLVAQLGFVIRWPEYQASLGVMVISVGIALLGVGLLTGLVCERLPAWFRLPVG